MLKHWRNRAAALGLSLCLVGALCPVARAAGPEVSAQSAVVLTADTGTVLFEKDGHTPRPVASTTKIMTALLALEAAQEQGDPLVDITQEMVAVEGSSMGLQAGDSISLTGLAAGMLLASGNDAANAAALYLDGSLESFAARMNQRAAALGMEDTHFVTPSGLDGEDAQGMAHLSTAYDMALLARAALENQAFRQLCSSPSLAVEFAEPVKRVTYTNHNKLLTQYQGCVGVKTGFTKEAGRCLVSAAERDGALLIAVTLNAPNDWEDHTALLDYGFSQVEPYQLAGGDVRLTVPVVGSPVAGRSPCLWARAPRWSGWSASPSSCTPRWKPGSRWGKSAGTWRASCWAARPSPPPAPRPFRRRPPACGSVCLDKRNGRRKE